MTTRHTLQENYARKKCVRIFLGRGRVHPVSFATGGIVATGVGGGARPRRLDSTTPILTRPRYCFAVSSLIASCPRSPALACLPVRAAPDRSRRYRRQGRVVIGRMTGMRGGGQCRPGIRLTAWLNWRRKTRRRTGPRMSGGRAGRTLRTGTPGCWMRPNAAAGWPTGAMRTARVSWPGARWRRPCSPGTPACGRRTCASTGPAASAASRTASRSSRAPSSRAPSSRARHRRQGRRAFRRALRRPGRGRGRPDPGRRGRGAA